MQASLVLAGVLVVCRTIMRHLQRIKSRRADIPNPDIPVRIHFAQQRVDTLCNGESLVTLGSVRDEKT